MAPRKFWFKPRRPRSKRGKKSGKSRVSKATKNYVKRELHRNIENKEVIRYTANEGITSTLNATPIGIPCIPALSQGTAENNRIGNNVKCVKGTITGRVNLLPYNATTNPLSTPILVKMWLVRHLGINGQVAMSGLSWTNFFRGNGTTLGFQQSPLDMFLPINSDYWKVLATKTFKLGAASATATGAVGTGGYFDNSPMSVPFYFNFGKKLRKILKYSEDNALNYPTNDNCYVAVQVVNADGSSTAVTPAEWHYVIDFKFEDA